MRPSRRLKRNLPQLRIAFSSPETFTAAVRQADRDFLTTLCTIAIAYATQQMRSPDLLTFLVRHRQFIYRVGDKSQTAEQLRSYLLANKRSYSILKHIVTHLLLYVR